MGNDLFLLALTVFPVRHQLRKDYAKATIFTFPGPVPLLFNLTELESQPLSTNFFLHAIFFTGHSAPPPPEALNCTWQFAPLIQSALLVGNMCFNVQNTICTFQKLSRIGDPDNQKL